MTVVLGWLLPLAIDHQKADRSWDASSSPRRAQTLPPDFLAAIVQTVDPWESGGDMNRIAIEIIAKTTRLDETCAAYFVEPDSMPPPVTSLDTRCFM
ncbi:MAG: hypothetical protein ABWY00_15750 [Dongiaceae bacterium]